MTNEYTPSTSDCTSDTLDILLRAERNRQTRKERCRRVQCTLSHTAGQETCHIFHSPTNDVEVTGLPTALLLHEKQGQPYDTATLRCKHTFNPSALFLHFLLTDMRCPVCRQGPEARMDITSLPTAIQSQFGLQLQAVRERVDMLEQEQALQDILDRTDIDMASLEAEFTFLMQMYVPSHFGVVLTSQMLQTRIRPIPEHTSGQFVHYVTQHSFQRTFNGMLRQHLDDPRVCIVFQIQHPLLPMSLSTETFNLQTLHETIRQNEFVASISLDYSMPGENILTMNNRNVQESRIMGTLVFTPHSTAPSIAPSIQMDTTSNANNVPEPGPVDQTDAQWNSNATLLIHRDGLLALCLTNLQQSIQQSIYDTIRESL